MTTLTRERPLTSQTIHDRLASVQSERDRASADLAQAMIEAARAECRGDVKHRLGLSASVQRLAMFDAIVTGLQRLAKVAERHELAERVADGARRIETARIGAHEARETLEAAMRRETRDLSLDTRSAAERMGNSPDFERLRSELAAEIEATRTAAQTAAGEYNRVMHAAGADQDRLLALDAADPSLAEERL